MSEDVRYELVGRVRSILAKLELLSEGRTSGGFDKPVVSGSTEHDGPKGERSLFDIGVAHLERWCKVQEAKIEQMVGNTRRPALNPTQKRYWAVQEYEGLDYRTAAEKAGVSEQTMWKWRVEMEREPRKGLPKAA